MATLKDVQNSMNGESTKKKEVIPVEQVTDIYAGIPNVSEFSQEEPQGKVHVFKLKNNTKKGGVYLPNEEDTVNPETGKIERMRLLNGTSEIWAKNQKDLSPEYIKLNKRQIHFPRYTKHISVAPFDVALLEFLRNSNNNTDKKNRTAVSGLFDFYEYDPAKEAQEAFQREEFELEMAIQAKQVDEAYMRKHCSFLGLSLVDPYTNEPKKEGKLRSEYVVYAKRNPTHFKNTLKSPQVDMFVLIRKALSEHLIEIDKQPNQINWAKDGSVIAFYPKGENPLRFLTQLALTPSDQGLRFKQLLEQLPL